MGNQWFDSFAHSFVHSPIHAFIPVHLYSLTHLKRLDLTPMDSKRLRVPFLLPPLFPWTDVGFSNKRRKETEILFSCYENVLVYSRIGRSFLDQSVCPFLRHTFKDSDVAGCCWGEELVPMPDAIHLVLFDGYSKFLYMFKHKIKCLLVKVYFMPMLLELVVSFRGQWYFLGIGIAILCVENFKKMS